MTTRQGIYRMSVERREGKVIVLVDYRHYWWLHEPRRVRNRGDTK